MRSLFKKKKNKDEGAVSRASLKTGTAFSRPSGVSRHMSSSLNWETSLSVLTESQFL